MTDFLVLYLMQTEKNQARYSVLQLIIRVYTVCQCCFMGILGINGLKQLLNFLWHSLGKVQ